MIHIILYKQGIFKAFSLKLLFLLGNLVIIVSRITMYFIFLWPDLIY
jgi:hypothetical protein